MQEKDLKKTMCYKRILNKNNQYINFYKSAEFMLKNIPHDINHNDYIIYKTTVLVTAPTLISYVLYILNNAKKQKINKLYFLARDGYIMKKIAEVLCKNYKIDIECKYLYCSRYVLRSPLYLINEEEAMQKFCQEGAKISKKIVLKRAGIPNSIQNKILFELNEELDDKILNKSELMLFGKRLNENYLFRREARKHAQYQYKKIYDYFFQEGIMDEKKFAIVDTGWMGSMQRSIRQIISYSGCEKNFEGYYFGMFENGKVEDGKYNCFYFSKRNNSSRRVLFNNNLFECMCSANHGMTTGYYKDDNGIILPIFKEYKEKWNINLQLNTIEKYVEVFVESNKWDEIKIDYLNKVIRKLLISFMIFPSKDEANVYGKIPFCDDSTESYMMNLAEVLSKKELYQYNIFYKVFKKIFLNKKNEKFHESFWINGSIKLSNISFKKIFNIGCIICEYIHYMKIKK